MPSLATDDAIQTRRRGVRAAPSYGADEALPDPLAQLGKCLLDAGYVFVCPSPESQTRVNARPQNARARTLVDVFGWSRPFHPTLLPAPLLEHLRLADAVQSHGAFLRSRVRYSTLGGRLFVHSAFPTSSQDAVFFGPDTYRFVSFVDRVLDAPWPYPVERLIDIGCGSGAGAILAGDVLDPCALREAVLSDINPRALAYASSNLFINRVHHARCVQADGLSRDAGLFDLILSNPPYMIDPAQRTYCHGGGGDGIDLPLRFLQQGVAHLALGGRLLLYTGTPVVDGEDQFRRAAQPILDAAQVRYEYTELDPDVFGEELARPEYAAVDRIAVVGLFAWRPGGPR